MLRFLWVLFLLAHVACLRTPPPHIRALEENELCAQYLQMGDLERAEARCEVGLQFSPQYGDLWTNKGLIALQRGQEEVAKKHFIKALRYNQEQAQAYQNLGYIYLKERKYGRAHDNFQRALKVNPDYAEARYNLALTYIALKKKELARRELLTLTEVYPNLADPHARLGQLESEAGNSNAAIEHFKRAVTLSPQYAEAWLALGNAYTQAGNFCEASQAYGSCIEASANIPECPNNLSISTRKCKLIEPKIKEIEELEGSEQTPESQYRLARAYKERGLRNEEQRAYERCLRYNNKYAPCYYGLFEIFYDERNDRKARIACQNFLKFADVAQSPQQHDICQRYVGHEEY